MPKNLTRAQLQERINDLESENDELQDRLNAVADLVVPDEDDEDQDDDEDEDEDDE